MRKTAFVVLLILLCRSPVFGQAGRIGLYTDMTGTQCGFADLAGDRTLYVVYTPGSIANSTGAQFAAPIPPCYTGASWLGDDVAHPITIGDSQTGVSVAYGSCLPGPVVIMAIRLYTPDAAASCCKYPVLPDPDVVSGEVIVTDCTFAIRPASGGFAVVNPLPECPCAGRVWESEYEIPQDVVGAGGHSGSSARYVMKGTAGQTFIGSMEGGSFDGKVGYWYNPRAVVTGVTDGGGRAPVPFALEQNWPNPFNPSTTIRFSIPSASRVSVRVYDVSGRLVETLVDKQMDAGVHDVVWDASQKASGVYFFRLEAPGFSQTRKLVLIK